MSHTFSAEQEQVDLIIAYLHKCKTDNFHSYEGKQLHQEDEDIQNSEILVKKNSKLFLGYRT